MSSRIVEAAAIVLAFLVFRRCPPQRAASIPGPPLIVAGDFHAHSGAPSEVFDNGRRDLAKALVSIGFAESNIQQYSTEPAADKDTHPGLSDRTAIYDGFTRLARQTSGGCFLYFTSHGNAAGILVGNELVTPHAIAQLVDDACADKATVVVISACYSGVFVPALASDTRMVITAARRDRSSFGCGEANQYTFFDHCMLESLPLTPNFAALGVEVQDCVAAREKADGVGPPSEPQVSMGSAVVSALGSTAYNFPPKPAP